MLCFSILHFVNLSILVVFASSNLVNLILWAIYLQKTRWLFNWFSSLLFTSLLFDVFIWNQSHAKSTSFLKENLRKNCSNFPRISFPLPLWLSFQRFSDVLKHSPPLLAFYFNCFVAFVCLWLFSTSVTHNNFHSNWVKRVLELNKRLSDWHQPWWTFSSHALGSWKT